MTGKVSFRRTTRHSSRFQTVARRIAVGIIPAALLLGHSPASAEVAIPAEARVMTGTELYMIFHGKTWKWESGAGRMEDEARVFRAFARSGTGETWAEGRWSVNDRGQLCLKAVWHSQAGATRDKTCFSHRIFEGTVYQKREPAGDWYVFKHAKPKLDDEFSRLVDEDLVAADLPAVQKRLKARAEETTDSVRRQAKANEVGGVQ